MSLLNGHAQLKKIKKETKTQGSDLVIIEEGSYEDKWEVVETKDLPLKDRIEQAKNGNANDKFNLAKYYEWQSRKDLLELAEDTGNEGGILAKHFHGKNFLEKLAKVAKNGKTEFGVSDKLCSSSSDIDKNIQEAVKWLTEAAESGHYGAQDRLRDYYSRLWDAHQMGADAGIMDEDSIKMAIRGLTPAADQGNYLSELILGKIYGIGMGTAEYWEDAIKYLTHAAEQDINKLVSIDAAEFLAIILGARSRHNKCKDDVKQALKWIELAITKDGSRGDHLLSFRQEMKQELTAELIKSSNESQPVLSAPVPSVTQHLMNKAGAQQILSTETNKEENGCNKVNAEFLPSVVCKP